MACSSVTSHISSTSTPSPHILPSHSPFTHLPLSPHILLHPPQVWSSSETDVGPPRRHGLHGNKAPLPSSLQGAHTHTHSLQSAFILLSLPLPPPSSLLPPPPSLQVGCTKEGILKAAQLELFSNSGFTLDLSIGVLHRAMWHVDNAYFIPHWRVVGRNCRTNVPSNTAFRGFGGPQGMLVAENFIGKVAKVRGGERRVRGKRGGVGRGRWEGGGGGGGEGRVVVRR